MRLSATVSSSIPSFSVSAPESGNMATTESAMKWLLLDRFEDDEDAFSLLSQNMLEDAMSSVTGILTVLLGGIAAISLIVGGIGIMNIMLVTVTERTREIGIRKAIGAGRGVILQQFLLESVVLCMIGCAIGVFLSWVVLRLISVMVASMGVGVVLKFPVFLVLDVAVEILHKEVFGQVLIGLHVGLRLGNAVVGEILYSLALARLEQLLCPLLGAGLVVLKAVLELALHFAYVGDHVAVTVVGLIGYQVVDPEGRVLTVFKPNQNKTNMNRRNLSFLVVAMLTMMFFSCSKTENGNVEYIPFQETADGQWGMISLDGKVLFKEEFKNKPILR